MEVFGQVLTELYNCRGIATKEEYERLQQATEEKRMKSEQTHLALEQHTAAHGC